MFGRGVCCFLSTIAVLGFVWPSECAVQGDVKLVGNYTQNRGRVEIFHAGVWGTVCDDGWGLSNADVVCRQLGFSGALQYYSSAVFGQGTGRIWMDEVYCTGIETQLQMCNFNGWGLHDCSHSEDVGVSCSGTSKAVNNSTVTVKLTGGSTSREGRVEVFYKNQWGTVCDDSWSSNDAQVVCRELGFGGVGVAFTHAYFGQGTGEIWMDGVRCFGHESRLQDCLFNGWGIHDCHHSEDAGVVCLTNYTGNDTRNGRDAVKLAGGFSNREGRVEVFLGGQWMSICYSYSVDKAAQVACRQLGYPNALNESSFGSNGLQFGKRKGPLWLTELQCQGDELVLQHCNFRITQDCHNTYDMSVACFPHVQDNSSEHGLARLVGFQSSQLGRLEINYQGVWGTVCHNSFSTWGRNNTHVACRQLGYQWAYTAWRAKSVSSVNAPATQSRPFWMRDVSCSGSESELQECTFQSELFYSCSHDDDVLLYCGEFPEPNITVRLAPKNHFPDVQMGLVEVEFDGQRGTICDNSWNFANAQVVCRELGFPGAVLATSASVLGKGSDLPIWMQFVSCNGSEDYLRDCSYNSFSSRCSHENDAGVICLNSTNSKPSLVEVSLEGNYANSGRVRLKVAGVVGSVCRHGWDIMDADVACRQAGYPGAVAAFIVERDYYAQSYRTSLFWLSEVTCTGTERFIQDCQLTKWGHKCDQYEAGVVCKENVNSTYSNLNTSTIDVRLVGPTSLPHIGLLQVRVDGVWGTVCSYSDSFSAARVACRQLGYSDALTTLANNPFDVQAIFPVWLDVSETDVYCNGTEAALQDCAIRVWGIPSLSCIFDSEEVVVVCTPNNTNNSINDTVRLVNSNYTYAGRVEVSFGELWGTVCSVGWTLQNSQVVCRQLGFADVFAYHFNNPVFGQGRKQPIWLTKVSCVGSEDRIEDCANNGWGVSDSSSCSHFNDVGIICSTDTSSTLFTPKPDTVEARLVTNGIAYAGRLEVEFGGVWGTVNSGFGWSSREARVACRQLGFSDALAAIYSNVLHIPLPTRYEIPVWWRSVYCYGDEQTLEDCSWNGWGFDRLHYYDAGVVCASAGYNVTANIDNIRLVNRIKYADNMGRVEVSLGGIWGRVCDRYYWWHTFEWNIYEANIVCRQLGFPAAVAAVHGNVFGPVDQSQPVWQSAVFCDRFSNATRLQDCFSYEWGMNPQCDSEVGVVCMPKSMKSVSNQSQISVRLSGGSSKNIGRVEVKLAGVWGTVCGSSWNIDSAYVVCGQLEKYTDAAAALTWHTFGNSSDLPVWLSEVKCIGKEKRIEDCQRSGWGASSCGSNGQAVAVCVPKSTTDIQEPNEKVRLVGLRSEISGHVEVWHAGVWGTICDYGWDLRDVEVVCRQLGHRGAVSILQSEQNNIDNRLPVWFGNVQCTGSEDQLQECERKVWKTNSCNHKNDAGAVCLPNPNSHLSLNETVRLMNGTSPSSELGQGRVEVLFGDNYWGTVCDYGWDLVDAQVVCKQLGFSGAQTAVRGAAFGAGEPLPISMGDVRCVESIHKTLQDCQFDSTAKESCDHNQDAGVICITAPARSLSPSVTVRLSGENSTNYRGRVEVFMNGVWGTICNYNWDSIDAFVVCHQIGLDGNINDINIIDSAQFGESTGPVWMGNVECTDHDAQLEKCRFDSRALHTCTHAEDVAVDCGYLGGFGRYNTTIRLVSNRGENFPHGGRVEIRSIKEGGNFGTVCDKEWDFLDAQVVCKQLRYSRAVAAVKNSALGMTSNPLQEIFMTEVMCEGNEDRLQKCKNEEVTYHCSHEDDAGVICLPHKDSLLTANVTVKLHKIPKAFVSSHRSSYTAGLIVLSVGGFWGLSCTSQWRFQEADVACRELKYTGAVAAARIVIPSEVPNLSEETMQLFYKTIWTDQVSCNQQDAKTLEDCLPHPLQFLGLPQCSFRDEFASAICYLTHNATTEPSPTATVKISDGGLVEVLHDGVWGTVCDTNWDTWDALVVCRELDYPGVLETKTNVGMRENTFVVNWMNNVQCKGTEKQLTDCRSDNWTSASCEIGRGAGVVCLPNIVYEKQKYTVRICDKFSNCNEKQHKGRVEVFHNGHWGSICNVQWTNKNSQVICRQLRLSGGNTLVDDLTKSNGTVWLDQVKCVGNETNIEECQHSQWGVVQPECDSHQNDVGVVCDAPSQTKEATGSNTIIWIVLAVVVPTCVFVIVVFIVLRWRKTHEKTVTFSDNVFLASNRLYAERLEEEKTLTDWPSYDDLQFDRQKLEFVGELGEGNFGKVYEAIAKDIVDEEGETRVAVKTLKDSSAETAEDFKKELEIMMEFHHPNIVSLLGVCTTRFPLLLILELMSKGNLKEFLTNARPTESNPTPGLSLYNLVDICRQVASGLAHMASIRFVHRDIAARNCLVGENNVVKISDFGMARDIYEKNYYKRRGKADMPMLWMAPEAITDSRTTLWSDVWSYGVLMWEVFTYGSVPYPSIQGLEQLLWKLSSGCRLQCPIGCPSQLHEMMLRCWAQNPTERISAAQLEQELGIIVLAMETNQPWQILLQAQGKDRIMPTDEDTKNKPTAPHTEPFADRDPEFSDALSKPIRFTQPNSYTDLASAQGVQNPIFGMELEFERLDSSQMLGLPATAERDNEDPIIYESVTTGDDNDDEFGETAFMC